MEFRASVLSFSWVSLLNWLHLAHGDDALVVLIQLLEGALEIEDQVLRDVLGDEVERGPLQLPLPLEGLEVLHRAAGEHLRDL